jgi:multiple sugar transport system ATP-binding protein
MAKITLNGVYKLFGEVRAVDDVSLEVADGEFLVLVGPSGCGKTTSLRMIAGFERPTYGEITIGERVVNKVAPKDRNLAMVFQSYALYPHMTVAKNLSFGMRVRRAPRAQIARRVQETAETLGLQDLLQRKPGQLSGGQRQRVALGRALLREPEAFLMDEPLSNLDAALRIQMRVELSRQNARFRATTVYVTHDQVEAMTMGDRIAVMSTGRMQQCDTPERLYERPANLFVAGFIGAPKMNLVAGRLGGADGAPTIDWLGQLVPLDGELASATLSLGSAEVTVGLRPEDLRWSRDAPTACTARMDALVDVVEPVGSETYVVVRVRGDTLTARFPSRSGVQTGDKVELAFDPAHLHIFRGDNGTSVLAPEAPPASAPALDPSEVPELDAPVGGHSTAL